MEFEILGVLGGVLASLDRSGLLANIGKSMTMISAASYVGLVGWKKMNQDINCPPAANKFHTCDLERTSVGSDYSLEDSHAAGF